MSVLTSVPTYHHIHVKVIQQSLTLFSTSTIWVSLGLNSGPHPCQQEALSTESFRQPICFYKYVEHYYVSSLGTICSWEY